MSGKPKILIVDDREENLVSVETILADIDAELMRANSGNEALTRTLEHEFALVLVDIQMSGMDGFETVALMRQEKRTEFLPVIFLSEVFLNDLYEVKGVELGALDIIERPLNPEVLFGKVRNFLDLYLYRKSLEARSEVLAEMVRESEDNYRTLFREMLDGFAMHEIITDKDGKPVDYRFKMVNPAFEAMVGMKADMIIGRTVMELLPETEDYWIETYGRVALTGKPEYFENYSGALDKYFEVRAFSPEPGHFACVFADVSSRKKAQQEREMLMSAIEQAAETILITDAEGVINYVNPAFTFVTGYTKAEAIGKNPSILKSGEHGQEFYRKLWKTLTSGHTWEGRIKNRRKNGEIYSEDATISPVSNSAGVITNYVAVKRDISDHLKMAAQLQQSQKLEAIGTLAGGIAHDFNNILSSIIGYGEMALARVGEESQAGKDLLQVLSSGKRAMELVKQILTISRQQEVETQPVKVQDIIHEALKLLRPTLSSRVEIITSIEEECSPVVADPTQIHQVIMNLCTNAYHAMLESRSGKDKRLTISLSLVELDGSMVSLRAGTYVELKISDTGCGMDEQTRARIFEPYFSTKEQDKGTGLGLAVLHGVVSSCSGAVQVESLVGVGTTFRVLLPARAQENIQPEKVEDQAPDTLDLSGNERIMVVDDEEAILMIHQRSLEKMGYNVDTFSKSSEAAEAFENDPETYDLVITDMNMPEITGLDLAALIIDTKADIPVILCSGFTDKKSVEDCEAVGIRDILNKPISRDQLLRSVRTTLNGKQ